MIYIGIDPGISGAIAFLLPYEQVEVYKMPDNILAIRDLFGTVFKDNAPNDVFILSEIPGLRPGQSVQSTKTTWYNYGQLYAYLVLSGYPLRTITPAKWKQHYGLSADKTESIKLAMQMFPQFKLKKSQDGLAEALLIADFARLMSIGGK